MISISSHYRLAAEGAANNGFDNATPPASEITETAQLELNRLSLLQ
jgi:hypothetical protein